MTNPIAQENSDDSTEQRLRRECGIIGWAALIRHFARGVVVHVDPELDLIEAAVCLSRDDTETLQRWLTDGCVARASDDNARDWTEREPVFQCVVVAPWVLVQEHTLAATLH